MRSTTSRLNCRGCAPCFSGGYGADRADRSRASALTDAGDDGLWLLVGRTDQNTPDSLSPWLGQICSTQNKLLAIRARLTSVFKNDENIVAKSQNGFGGSTAISSMTLVT